MATMDQAMTVAAKEIVALARARQTSPEALEGAASRLAQSTGFTVANARAMVRLAIMAYGEATG